MKFNLTKYQQKQELVLDATLQSLSYFEDDGNLVKLIVSYLGITPTNHAFQPPSYLHPSRMNVCRISSTDEWIMTGYDDGMLHIFDTVTGDWLRSLVGHSPYYSVTSCCLLSDDNYLVSVSDDETIRLWNTMTGDCVRTFADGTYFQMNSCCVSSTDTFMVSSSSNRTLKMWDLSTGTCTKTFKGHKSHVNDCCISSVDDFIVSASNDETVKVWDVATGICTTTLRGHTDYVLTCCLSSTDQFIVSTSDDNTLKVWNVATGNCTHTFTNFGNICALSGDDQRVVAADNDNDILCVLNLETEEVHYGEMGTRVYSVCWSSDNQFLVFGTSEGVEIRDSNTLELFNVDETDSE